MMNSSHRGVWRCMRKRGVAIRPKGEGKMRRSLIKILVLALILSVMLTALNYEPRANYDPEEKRFACIINYGFNYWTGVQNGAEEAGEDDNVSIDVYSFELMDTQRQIQLMKKMEYMKVDGIITMGDPNNEELNNEIARLSEEGIPVALIDSDSPQSKRACYIGSDNYAIGQQAAKVLAEKTEESAKIIVMVSKMEYANQQERYQGFADEIAKYKDMQILADLDLTNEPQLEFARDLYLFSFYAQGMAFVDIVLLKEADICNGVLTYSRHKSKQLIRIAVTQKYFHHLP